MPVFRLTYLEPPISDTPLLVLMHIKGNIVDDLCNRRRNLIYIASLDIRSNDRFGSDL